MIACTKAGGGSVQTGSNSYLTIFKAFTPDGGTHQLAQMVGGTTYESIDASGIRYNGWMGTGTNEILLDRSGFGANGSTSFARDTNGNKTSYQTDGSLLDTLGRTVGNSSTGSNSGPNGCSSQQPAGVLCFPGPNGSARLIKLTYTTVSLSTNFQARARINDLLWPVRETTTSATMLQSVAVYDGLSWTTSPQWTFQYSPNADGSNYGDLTQITLPTGGTVSYAWAGRDICGDAITPKSRGVTSRTVNANDGMGNQITSYSAAIFNNSGTVTVTDPASNDAVHTITGLGATCSLYDTQTDYYKGTGASRTLLKTVQTAYSWSNNPFDQYGDGTQTKANVVPTSVTTKWPIPNSSNFLVSQVQTDYDNGFSFYPGPTSGGRYGRVLERREYDYGVNTPGPLLRKTDYTYKAVSGNAYLTANLLDLVATKTIYNGTGVQMAKTTYAYDGTTLQSSGITQQHLSLANPGTRGNLTLIQDWLNTSGSSVTTRQTSYYDTGMPYQSTDLKGNRTTYSYDPAYYGAYVTQTQYPNTGAGNSVTHTISGTYDFGTGEITSFTDQNNQASNYHYDLLGRVTSGSFPDGGSISFGYTNTVPWQIQKTVAITGTMNKVSNAVFDGLGRVSQTQLHDPDCQIGSGLVKMDYAYGNDTSQNTQYTTITTPYCDTPGTTFGLPTRTDMDPLGRVSKVTQTDGSVVSTSYASNCTTVADEAGKSRKSCSDGLGRMTSVFEDPSGLNFETDYVYSALDNLTSLTQKGGDPNSANWRNRSFVYDSLSRLTSAANPESGTISYTYSNTSTGCSLSTGTVCTKIAPAPNQTGSATVTTTYAYDNLDRLTGKTYSDGTTPGASFGYDGTALTGCTTAPPSLTDTYPKGQRTAMCDGSGATSWAHDQMGRVLTESRTVVGTSPWTKSAGYTYNLDGSLKTVSNPGIGRVMTYTTNAAGRPVSVVNTGGGLNFVTGATYAPQGALATYTNGSNILNTNTYNSRLQPLALTAATTGTGAHSILNLSYDFHSSTHADNGNVYQIVNGRDGNRTQNFQYDSLNRIQQAYTNGTNWGETFGPTATSPGVPPSTPGIDPWGNLTNRSGVTGKTLYEPLSASATVKNQLTGYGYDAAGNMTSNGSVTYTYNAENRLISIPGWTYVYDGDGHRVKKVNGSSGTLYWPNLNGDTLNESSLGATNLREYVYLGGKRVARIDVPAPLSVKYYFSDYLGSASVITDSSGTMPALEESDYYPYGGEISITNGDSNNYKFTGKERDSESGLDNFGARYDASSMGRFMTPDPLMASAKVWNPQTWNRYAYALNNPLRYIDPTGMNEVTAEQCQKDPKCVTVKVNVIYDKNANDGNGLTDKQKADFEKGQLQSAKDQYGNANIHLDVTYTEGTMSNENGKTSISGLKTGALNVFVSDQVQTSSSGLAGKTAVSWVNPNSNDLAHEMAHQFMGDTQGWRNYVMTHDPTAIGAILLNTFTDLGNDFERAWMRNVDQHSGALSHYPLASAFHYNAATFQKMIQPTTKPDQQ